VLTPEAQVLINIIELKNINAYVMHEPGFSFSRPVAVLSIAGRIFFILAVTPM